MPGGPFDKQSINICSTFPTKLREVLTEDGLLHESSSEAARITKEAGHGKTERSLVYMTDKVTKHFDLLPKKIRDKIRQIEEHIKVPGQKRGRVMVQVRIQPVNLGERDDPDDPTLERYVYFLYPLKRAARAVSGIQTTVPKILELLDVLEEAIAEEIKGVPRSDAVVTVKQAENEMSNLRANLAGEMSDHVLGFQRKLQTILFTLKTEMETKGTTTAQGEIVLMRYFFENKIPYKGSDAPKRLTPPTGWVGKVKCRECGNDVREDRDVCTFCGADMVAQRSPDEYIPVLDEEMAELEVPEVDHLPAGQEPGFDGVDNYSRSGFNKYDWASVEADLDTPSGLMRVISPMSVKPAFMTPKFSKPEYQVMLAKSVGGMTFTPWFRSAYLAALFKRHLESLIIKGKPVYTLASTPQLKDVFNLTIHKQLLDAKNEPTEVRVKIVEDYLHDRDSGILAMPTKPLLSVASSPLNCSPTKNCAKYCYAFGGQGGATSNIFLVELIEFLVRYYPERVGPMIMDALEDATTTTKIPIQGDETPEGRKDRIAQTQKFARMILDSKAPLRFFDRGEGGLHTNWLQVIEYVNSKGVRAHVFSKRADFLAKIDPSNVRILSADRTNYKEQKTAADNLDLKIGYVYVSASKDKTVDDCEEEGKHVDCGDDFALRQIGAKRLCLILPVHSSGSKGKDKFGKPKETEVDARAKSDLHKFFGNHPEFAPLVCPKDYHGFWRNGNYVRSSEDVHNKYHCHKCDSGNGQGCYYKQTTSKTWAVSKSVFEPREEKDNDDEYADYEGDEESPDEFVPPFPPPPTNVDASDWKAMVDTGVDEMIAYVDSFGLVKSPGKTEAIKLMNAMTELGIKMPTITPDKVDQAQLKMGIEVEGEHTTSKVLAMLIALGHLEEEDQERYYTELRKMESAAKRLKASRADMDLALIPDPGEFDKFDNFVSGMSNHLNIPEDQVRKSPSAYKYALSMGYLKKK